MRYYPEVPREPQSFVGVKKCVLPNQSMTLQEIIRRFVKKESLPIEMQGVYNDSYDYDLEKLGKADITVREEVVAELKVQVAEGRRKEAEYLKAKADKEALARQSVFDAAVLAVSQSKVVPPV